MDAPTREGRCIFLLCAAALYHDSPDTYPQGRVLIHSKQAYARTQPHSAHTAPQTASAMATGTMYHRHGADSLSGYRWHVLRLYTMTARTHTHRGAC